MNNDKKNWIFLGIALILFPLFFLGGPDFNMSRFVGYFWNTGHIFFYTITVYLLLHFSKPLSTKSFKFQFATIILLTLFTGIMIEFIQYGINRTPDTGDLLRNIIGSLVGLFFFSSSRKLIPKSRLIPVQVLIIGLLLLEALPIAAAFTDEWNARKKFPVLADFENPLEISRWTGDTDFKIIQDKADSQNHYLEIKLGTSKYSGVFLKYSPRNWEEYNSLTFSIYNPSSKNLQITCRVHDMQHSKGKQLYNDRYNKNFLLRPGENTFKIMLQDILEAPVSRKMNSQDISGIGFFVTQEKKHTIIYLDDIMLLKEKPES